MPLTEYCMLVVVEQLQCHVHRTLLENAPHHLIYSQLKSKVQRYSVAAVKNSRFIILSLRSLLLASATSLFVRSYVAVVLFFRFRISHPCSNGNDVLC